VFGVRSSLLGYYRRHEAGETAPDGTVMNEPFYTMHYDLVMTKPVAPARTAGTQDSTAAA
jgi:hydroxyquinol 1,2-dioxygenase